jgi:N-methylhydantoinase A
LGQNYELEVPFGHRTFSRASTTELWRAFHALHQTRFGFHIPGEVIEVITLRCTAVCLGDKAAFPARPAGELPRPLARRDVWFGNGWLECDVYARDTMPGGARLTGPVLIEEAATVTVVEPGQILGVSASGHLVIERAAGTKG